MMSKIFVLSLASIAMAGALSSEAKASQPLCAGLFSGTIAPELAWRETTTNTNQSGELGKSDATREAEIKKREDLMFLEIAGQGQFAAHGGDIPPIELFAEAGVKETYLHHSDGTNGESKIVLSNVGNGGKLKATLLLPVSGHVGFANATKWRFTDVYSVKVDYSKDKDGTQWNSNWGGSPTEKPLVTDAKSLEYVTKQEIEIQLNANAVTRILYYRGGSGGPSGYWDGRVIELVWDGT